MKIFHLWIILSVYIFYENEAKPTTTAIPSTSTTTTSPKGLKEVKKIKRGVVSISQLQHQPGGHFHYYPFAHHQHSQASPTYNQGYTVSQIRTYEPTSNVMKTAADNIHESQYYISNTAPLSPTTPSSVSSPTEQPTITPYFAMSTIINPEVSAGHHHVIQHPTHPESSNYQPQHHIHHYGAHSPNYVSQQTEFIPSPRAISSHSTIQTHPSIFYPITNSQSSLNRYNPQVSNFGQKVQNYNTYPLNIVTPQSFTPSHRNYNPQGNKVYHYNTLSGNNGQFHPVSSTTASPLRHTTAYNRKNTDGSVTPYPVQSYVKKPSHLPSSSHKKPHPSESKSKSKDEEIQENKENYDDDRNDSEEEEDDEDVPHSSKYRTTYRKPNKYTSYKSSTYYDDNDESEYHPRKYHRHNDEEDDDSHSSNDYDNEEVEADTKIVKHRKKYSKRNENTNNNSNKPKKFVTEKPEKPVYEKVNKAKKTKVPPTNKPVKKVEVIEGKYSNQVPVTVGHKKHYQANWYYSSVKNEE